MYDFDVDSIQDMLDFFQFNRDISLKKDRNIFYYAITHWTLDGAWDALQYVPDRPCWNWDAVRSQILTWWWFHSDKITEVKQSLTISVADQPIVVARIINIEGSRKQFERKLNW